MTFLCNFFSILNLKVFDDKSNKFFFLFLFFYFILGCIISYQDTVEGNIYFGADNYRAFGDLTQVFGWHNRIKVHPLFLLFTQPITLLINGIVHNDRLSVIILQSLCGALFVKTFFKILLDLNLKAAIIKYFSLILGFSFSFIMFTSTPETFIFTGLSSIIFFYYLVTKKNCNDFYTKKNVIILVLFSTLLTGMVITNYVLFLVGITVLLFYIRNKILYNFSFIFKLAFLSFFFILFLSCLQKIVWNNCPIFISSLLDGLLGKGYEETLYIQNNYFDISEMKNYLLLFFAYPLFSTKPQLFNVNNSIYYIVFTEYNIFQKLFICFFTALISFAILLFLFNIFKLRKLNNKFPLILGSSFLFFNLSLHFLYGKSEAFIYSCHFLYLVLICLAIILDNLLQVNIKLIKIFSCFALVFTMGQFINNLYNFNETRILAYVILNKIYILTPVIRLFIYYFIGILIFFAFVTNLRIINSFLDKPDLSASVTFNKSCIKNIALCFFVACFIFELVSITLQAGGLRGFLQLSVEEFHLNELYNFFVMKLNS